MHQKNMNRSFEPIIRPDALVTLNIPITDRVALQSGAGYRIRGYTIFESESYIGGRMEFRAKDRMHYLSIPLLASFKAYQNPNMKLWIDAGMNYDIFLSGNLVYEFENYTGNNLDSRQTIKYTIKGRFDQSKYGATENTYDVDALNVSVKFQLRLIAKDRYTISLYHIHDLYDNRANPDDNRNTSFKYRYTGISIGYRLF